MTPPINQSEDEENASLPSPLLRAWRTVDVGTPPLTQLLAAGRVARRRRRALRMTASGATFAAVASVAVVLAVSVGSSHEGSATRNGQVAGSTSSTSPSADAPTPLNMSPAPNSAFPIHPGETLPEYQERLAATSVALRECPELADFITDEDKAKFIAESMGSNFRFVGGCPDAEQLRAAFERSR